MRPPSATRARAARRRARRSRRSRARRHRGRCRPARARARVRAGEARRSGRRAQGIDADAWPELRLEWKPEPGVERRKDEDERERLGQRDHERDGAEPRERTGVAGETLFGGSLRPRERADGEGASQPRTNATASRAIPGNVRIGDERRVGRQRQRSSGRARRPSAPPTQRSTPAHSQKKHPRSQRPHGRPEREGSAPAPRKQIENAERERHDRDDESESHGPPARRALLQEDAVRCAKRRSDARVDRADECLRGAPELTETPLGELLRAISPRRHARSPDRGS